MSAGAAPQNHAACAGPIRRRQILALAVAQNCLLAVLSILMALVMLELAIRIYHGELTTFSSHIQPPPSRASNAHARFDAVLGWVPERGRFVRPFNETWTVNDAGLRSNGSSRPSTKRPIVAVGDSFTFGDEVLDHETWPAHLERLVNIPVLNGGVFAYGVDQAFLRAVHLLDVYRPQLLLLAFISDDVSRAEFSFYSGWKPYFEYAGGVLALRNVPVPVRPGPAPRYATLRTILGYSFLFNALLSRTAPAWWSPVTVERAHNDGESVAVDLFVRLQTLAETNDANLVVIALATNGRIGGNGRLQPVVDQAQQRGIAVINLLPDLEQMPPDSQAAMFKPRGHYAPSMNARVAARVAAHLQTLQTRSR